MATATQIALNVKGVNQTGGVFNQIAKQAKSFGSGIASMTKVGAGVAVAAGAAFLATAKSLGSLSDIAMRASTSADDLTKLSTAFDVLGIKSNTPDQIAQSFQRMAKATGQTGVEGFKNIIVELSKLESVEQRSAGAMAVFGRTGLDYMPLIEAAAKNDIEALNDVMAAMPGVSQSAADAGDSVADAMTLMTSTAKSLWQNAIGEICAYLDANFEGGVRGAAMRGSAYFEYFAKAGLNSVTYMVKNMGLVFDEWGNFVISFFNAIGENIWNFASNFGKAMFQVVNQSVNFLKGDGFDVQVFSRIKSEMKNGFAEMSKDVGKAWDEMQIIPPDLNDDLKKQLKEKLELAKKAAAQVAKAATMADNSILDSTQSKTRTTMKEMRNAFIQSGTYAEATAGLRQGMSGNDKQLRETKKNGSILEKIRKGIDNLVDKQPEVEVF